MLNVFCNLSFTQPAASDVENFPLKLKLVCVWRCNWNCVYLSRNQKLQRNLLWQKEKKLRNGHAHNVIDVLVSSQMCAIYLIEFNLLYNFVKCILMNLLCGESFSLSINTFVMKLSLKLEWNWVGCSFRDEFMNWALNSVSFASRT